MPLTSFTPVLVASLRRAVRSIAIRAHLRRLVTVAILASYIH